ncbi:MAG: protein-glutamate O-methyltransferase CheR [Nitrospirota bacterium]
MGDLKSFSLEGHTVPACTSAPPFPEHLSDEEFSLFADLIYSVSGIWLSSSKKGLLISRLSKRLKCSGCKSFYEYYQNIKHDNKELIEMLNCISTNTTKFFRENYHFEYLKKTVIPWLISDKAAEKRIRIWSAGCSTGEEPYSIAITVLEAFRAGAADPASWDIKVLATDISTRVLETAQAGIYECEQLPEDIQSDMVSRYFLKGTGEYTGKIKVKECVRELIRFRRLNLKDERYPFQSPFDVIFCRNVMIYFDEGMRRHVLSRFHAHLIKNGYLFLGHSEAMFDKEQFTPVHITVYRKN